MLAYVSLVLAIAAVAINLGWLELPTGHWPGISLGLASVLAGALQLRTDASGQRGPTRVLAWIGAALGLGAALLGIAVYLGWGIAAGRVG